MSNSPLIPGTTVRILSGQFMGQVGTINRVLSHMDVEVLIKDDPTRPPIFVVVARVNLRSLEAKPTMTAMQVANGEADARVAWLPPGASVVFTAPSLNDSHEKFFAQAYDGTWVTEEDKKKRKAEGRCETCGELRPMSIHGLLDCPEHPTDTGPVKQ